MKVAVIDTKLAYGQPGQYIACEAGTDEMMKLAAEGVVAGKEIRYYYRNLTISAEGPVTSQFIITVMPPGHVQPFHTHYNLNEMTLVTEGSVISIDHDTLSERDIEDIQRLGHLLDVGDMAIVVPGVRHTLMNPTTHRAILLAVQTARIPLAEFPADWVRDNPVGKATVV